MRERLAEHRESAFMSREIGRILTDLPVELELDEARTGRYDRRAVAQRLRELEFRSLIDRLPASSIAPTGHDAPERETKGGLQLSLDLLGGASGGRRAAPERRASSRTRSRIPGGAIEHVDPRIVRTEATGPSSRRGSRRTATGSASAGRPAPGDRWSDRCSGSRWRGARRVQLVRAVRPDARERDLPAWFARDDRRPRRARPEAARRHARRDAGSRCAGRASTPWSPATWSTRRSARRRSTTWPRPASAASCRRSPLSPETGAEEVGVRASRRGRGAHRAPRPARRWSRSSATAALANLFDEVEMPLVAGARPHGAGRRPDRPEPRWRRCARSSRRSSPGSRRASTSWSGTSSTSAHPSSSRQILFDELGLPVDEADANRPLDRRIGPGGAARRSTR